MKILVGVDDGQLYRSALNLAARLRFKSPQWMLAHSVDLGLPIMGSAFGLEASFGVDYVEWANSRGQEALNSAEEDACAHGIRANAAMLSGNAAGALIEYADDRRVDLLAVHSQRKSGLGSLFLGSVSRGLAISAKHSVLISKGEVAPTGSVRAVFATDHSEYAGKALERLLRFRPKGVEHITVLHAFHLGLGGSRFDLADSYDAIEERLLREAQERTDSLVEKLRKAGYTCRGIVSDSSVAHAIDEAMRIDCADLLIIGAQGHGFLHRLVLGSTALHQVTASPYSVLLLRA